MQKRASAALEAGRKAKQDQEERQQKRRARHEKVLLNVVLSLGRTDAISCFSHCFTDLWQMKTLRLSNRKAVYYDDENAES